METLQTIRDAALDDAARRTGLPRASLRLLSVEAVTWADGSLGCPQPGLSYTMALVPGFRVRIEADHEILEYHAGRRGPPAYCPPERIQPALPDASS